VGKRWVANLGGSPQGLVDAKRRRDLDRKPLVDWLSQPERLRCPNCSAWSQHVGADHVADAHLQGPNAQLFHQILLIARMGADSRSRCNTRSFWWCEQRTSCWLGLVALLYVKLPGGLGLVPPLPDSAPVFGAVKVVPPVGGSTLTAPARPAICAAMEEGQGSDGRWASSGLATLGR
jgi:hypothetical protein